ncbi:alpha subunit of anthranilate synthase [Chloropicon primus]|uniref:anthranilate synthase n=1 Tax=Chloropicon primus TaxID=1764295 RepID=A0A5B8MGP2_9CHLO|nr:alpha subunit of anthranilate synthase [Chloropicon primus]UPQ98779.1 alpha subunit of anthranilate synthase [Chloropicon primus]|eukprot:QDZ19567.1 alpha subunit of anthranilate synthase [Chloropicon primus]
MVFAKRMSARGWGGPRVARRCAAGRVFSGGKGRTSRESTEKRSSRVSLPSRSPCAAGGRERGLEERVVPKAVKSEGSKSASSGGKKGTKAFNLLPVYEKTFADHLNPILAYRCITKEDSREAPSFLFESVENGEKQGRYSFIGSKPKVEILGSGSKVTVMNHLSRTKEVLDVKDPLSVPEQLSKDWKIGETGDLPEVFSGGWVGYIGYDTVRYVYPNKIPFETAPEDDRGLSEMYLALYDKVVIFDNAKKCAYAVVWMDLDDFETKEEAAAEGKEQVAQLVQQLRATASPPLLPGQINIDTGAFSATNMPCNMKKEDFLAAVTKTKEHIQAGDIFQLVLSQRFERRTFADPFEIYRALRVVNPSPYMIYLQTADAILIASSPEILCRVNESRVVTNRPLAGTRRRGKTDEEDVALEENLLADEKEKSEHIMLVDLGRNDVGVVSKDGTVNVESMMDIERYSHVMHISSTVTGELKDEVSSWDALRAALPAGTVSGAPKVRAMQIIDELEVNRRGPYAGGIGYVGFNQNTDIALALRTMIIPTYSKDRLYSYDDGDVRKEWCVYIQAGAGLVADSDPESEYQETVNKSAALSRAIDLAEDAFMKNE